MSRILLIHSKPDEAAARIGQLEAAGHEVAYHGRDVGKALKELIAEPPDALVINLDRAPSLGRDIGIAVRKSAASRRLPLVFAGGEAEKVAPIRAILPDATYTSWNRIRSALKRALAKPPAEPVVPKSVFSGYAGTPLPKKLGIKPGSVVGLLSAPDGFAVTLGALPDGATLRSGARGRCDIVVWFVRSRGEFARRLDRMAARTDYRALWIAWPKKSSGVACDLTQQQIRESGLASGLVDYKVCSIDAVWTGLCFTHRKG